jgi:hypothetical protein
MTRKLRRNSLFGFVAPLMAIVSVMITLTIRAQVNVAGPPSEKSYVVPVLPGTGYTQRLGIGASQSNGPSAAPMAATPLFGLPVTYDPGGSNPWGVAVADLNADGRPDVVVTNASSATVGVLLGNGHGWFEPPLTYNSGAGSPLSVAIGDVNGDGIRDIVVANSAVRVQDCGIGVLLGNGDGTFKAVVTYGSSLLCDFQSVVIADLNGDGKVDVAGAMSGNFTGANSGNIVVLLGNGDGTFQPAVTYGSGVGSGGGSLAVADLNGDGKPDFVVATGETAPVSGQGTVGVLLGNGDGTFQPALTYASGGEYALSVAVADLNGDGKPDIAVTNVCPSSLCGTVAVLLGNGDSTFQPAVPYGPGGLEPRSVVIADVNADGKPDLVVANECANNTCATGTVGVLVGNGNGTFQPAIAYSASGLALRLAVADVNGDGKVDVVVTEPPTKVSVLLTATGVATTTVVTTSGSPSTVGQPVTFTATITPSQGTIPDGELVAFYDGVTMLGSAKLASGKAACSTSSLSAKSHTINAKYVGDTTFRLGSGNVQQLVLKYPTTTVLGSSLNPSIYGQLVTLTATVTSAGPVPTGNVTFKTGSVTLGNKTLNTSGVATLTTAKIPVGTNTLTATYNADAFNGRSVSAAITQTVSQATVHMVLTSTPNPSAFGTLVHFTAKLTSNGGLPTGQSVTFSYNGATLGTAIVTSTGVATFSMTTLPQGSDAVTATYAGNVDYSSASATVTQVVN